MTVVSSDSSDTMVRSPSGGSMPAGGPPDGSGALPDGGIAMDVSGVAPAVDQAQNTQSSAGLSGTAVVPSTVIDAVIESLQQRIAA